MCPGNRYTAALTVAIILASFPLPGAAAEPGSDDHHSEQAAHESHPRNLVAVFAGTTFEERRDRDPALGIEYERRLSSDFGVGVLAERTFDEAKTWVFAVPFALHRGAWKFYLAPGIEDSDRGASERLLRIGGEYAFEVGGREIAPQIDIDLVDGEQVYVLGVTFGIGF